MTTSREYPDRPLVGVGGVVLDGERVLLARRARPPLRGEWSLPGGLVEVGETLSEALRREIREETGLRVEVQGILKVLDHITFAKEPGKGRNREPDRGRRVRYHYVLMDFLCRVKGAKARAGAAPELQPADDVSDARWVRRRDLGRYSLRAATLRVIITAMNPGGGRGPAR